MPNAIIIPEMELDLGPTPEGVNRLFGSFVDTDSGLRGVCRETRFEESNKFNGDLIQMRLDRGKVFSTHHLTIGEDPRVFRFDDRIYVLSWEYQRKTKDWTHFIIDLDSHHRVPVEFPLAHQGKNWFPVVGRERLLIVYSLVPFVSFWVDPLTGRSEIFTRPSSMFDGFTEWRGGGVSHWLGDDIYGFGHRTISPNRHQPFWFKLNPLSGAAEFIPLNDDCFQTQGFFVNDPTSCLNSHRLIICSTPSAWTEPQPVKHTLCRVSFE